jgi:hemin uptake protein HemP
MSDQYEKPEAADKDAMASAVRPDLAERRRLSSAVLFGQSREVVIAHNGDEYRLRLTSQGKLILTK